MDSKEIKHKNKKELNELLTEQRAKLRELRFHAGENQLKDVRAIRKTRKNIAQLLTALGSHAIMEPQKNETTS